MIDLREWEEAIQHAKEEDTPCIAVSAGRDGRADISFKGSMLVFDHDHLAWWEYTKGEQLIQIAENPYVTIQYRSLQRGLWLRFYGEATIVPKGDIRQQVMERTNPYELSKDPERKGAAVLVRVDRVRLSQQTIQVREGVGAIP